MEALTNQHRLVAGNLDIHLWFLLDLFVPWTNKDLRYHSISEAPTTLDQAVLPCSPHLCGLYYMSQHKSVISVRHFIIATKRKKLL